MVKVNIISGFLGAGKTTFIKKLISDVFKGEKLVLIENEFGQIGVDGGFLKEAGIEITEMNSGCICCSLVGDFTKALEKTVEQYKPDRIIIEPSGVGKLSDVISAVNNTDNSEILVDSCVTVVDCTKCKIYRKNFGEFYVDQILHSDCILFTRTDKASQEKIEQATEIIREINKDANIITTHIDALDKSLILDAFEKCTLENELMSEVLEHHHEHHHHEHHHGHEECDCGCHEHEHHHHEHHHHGHEECDCGCYEHEHHHHEHHHEHEECDCGCHEHHHHHEHHHADEVFVSWGFETAKSYTESEIKNILLKLDSGEYGEILRAKGMVSSENQWLYFDYVPEEQDIRYGSPFYTGKICVIGAKLDEQKLSELFGKNL
ncbi:MAG: GTP-binding protein [Clostridia bacterium]|nr:GTP-binding protein [Clostridia bacterium]